MWGAFLKLIQDGKNGFLCPPANPECLAEKILVLISDAKLRERLGRAARAAYEQSPFGARSVGNYFASVYSEVLEERKLPGLPGQVAVRT